MKSLDFQINRRVYELSSVMSCTEKPLADRFYPAYMGSTFQAAQYMGRKSLIPDAPPPIDHDVLAVARLQWLLARTTPSISGFFKLSEIAALLEVLGDHVFFPDQLDTLAVDICVHYGIDPQNGVSGPVAELLAKVLGLSPAQLLSLAEVLEDVWHLDAEAGLTVVQALERRGVLLVPEEAPPATC